jgi:glycine betaine/choline ABC-type transport system substrate-binding protein
MTGGRVKDKMMLNRRDFLKIGGAGLAGAALLGVAGCGGGGGGGSSSGPKVSVGSKKFTEQILLGEMYAQAFEDKG